MRVERRPRDSRAARLASCRHSSGWASSRSAPRASCQAAGPARGCWRCSAPSRRGRAPPSSTQLTSGYESSGTSSSSASSRSSGTAPLPRRRARSRRPSSSPRPTAGVDELRQGLDPSRVPAVGDVVVDALGALLGLAAWTEPGRLSRPGRSAVPPGGSGSSPASRPGRRPRCGARPPGGGRRRRGPRARARRGGPGPGGAGRGVRRPTTARPAVSADHRARGPSPGRAAPARGRLRRGARGGRPPRCAACAGTCRRAGPP